jgi:RimJ/RimL family protein N-acetyltransferase
MGEAGFDVYAPVFCNPEAPCAALDFGFETLSRAKITSHIVSKNIRLKALAKRLG